MLMVSDANTNPGLTKAWDPGEPDKYYPSGKRNYARIPTTDDYQGTADSRFAAEDLKVKQCYVVNDNSTYGQGVARAFVAGAQKVGIHILGNTAWDSKQPNYVALFTKIKTYHPDCLFIGGTYDLNGGQLVKDKYNVLGDNTTVKMMGRTASPATRTWTSSPVAGHVPELCRVSLGATVEAGRRGREADRGLQVEVRGGAGR